MIRLSFVSALLFAVPAAAHSPLPTADWCVNGQLSIAGTFGYNGSQLAAELHAYCDSTPRNCGEFDHAYERATTLANVYCTAYQGPLGHGGDGQVIAFVMAPSSYLGQNHHAAYGIPDGLAGYCLRCREPHAALPVTPVGPRPPAR